MQAAAVRSRAQPCSAGNGHAVQGKDMLRHGQIQDQCVDRSGPLADLCLRQAACCPLHGQDPDACRPALVQQMQLRLQSMELWLQRMERLHDPGRVWRCGLRTAAFAYVDLDRHVM